MTPGARGYADELRRLSSGFTVDGFIATTHYAEDTDNRPPARAGWRRRGSEGPGGGETGGTPPYRGQLSRTHQVLVDGVGGLAAFADRPDDQRLATAHVAGREDLVDRRAIVLHVRCHVLAAVEIDAEIGDHPFVDGVDEAHGQ